MPRRGSNHPSNYNFDAHPANDRTLCDPVVIRVEACGRVRPRIIKTAAATVFWIDTGAVQGRLVAVDGDAVLPVAGTRFGIAMAQRLDIEIDLPAGLGAFPTLALREGAREHTAIVLATAGAEVQRIDSLAETKALALTRGWLRKMQPMAAMLRHRMRKLDTSWHPAMRC